MSLTQSDWLNVLKPNYKVLPFKERLLCGLGALLGLALSSLISWWVLGDINAWYIAPMGASSGIVVCCACQSFGAAVEYCQLGTALQQLWA